MTQPQKNTALAAGIIAGILSLPLTWMTIRNAEFQGDFGTVTIPFGPIAFNVTGLNGSVTFLITTPLWFIVCIAIGANALQLMEGLKSFAIPRQAQWATAIIAVGWIGLAVVSALTSGNVTLGIGALFGLLSATIPIVCLMMSTALVRTPDSTGDVTIGAP